MKIKISKNEFLGILKDLASTIEMNDSFEGSLAYEVDGDGFLVEAFYRIGNADGGQGEARIIGEQEKDGDCPNREIVEMSGVERHTAMDMSLHPQGNCYESGAGLQCCCPVCPYGTGDQHPFIAGMSEAIVRTCSKCGTKYIGLEIVGLPVSGKAGW